MTRTRLLLTAAVCAVLGAATGGTALAQQPTQPDAGAPASAVNTGAAPLGSSWADVTSMPDFFSGSWQSIRSFLDVANDTPFTPEAQAHIAQYKGIEDIPFAGPGCPTPGMPIVQRLGSPLKFFYEPGMIAIYIENSSMTRFIRLNGTHPERPNPSYLGDSIGHFEGDTLVVESISFADDMQIQYTNFPGKNGVEVQPGFVMVLPPDSIFGPHGPNMRIVERFRVIDGDTLELQTTIHDDTVWTQPYVSNPIHIFVRNKGEAGVPKEWVCGSGFDPVEFDPDTNETVMQDPAEVLRRLQEGDRRN